ncbi:DUF6303 family protein [Streptomyces sp. NBC_00080]|uniref:DUF6303 family protein n=1 Tax=Streptomyces sp. NBC_00080 TaxID=2975645 RepID=UPI003244D81B
MKPREFTAQMCMSMGQWLVFVALRGEPTPWPEHSFEGERLPTFTERVQALKGLGFEPVPGAVWQWQEFSDDPADPASPAHLLAYVGVRSRREAAA